MSKVRKAKKKVDTVALKSSFMRIPGMEVELARGLLDIGLKETYQLRGRSAYTLLEDIEKRRGDLPVTWQEKLEQAILFVEKLEES